MADVDQTNTDFHAGVDQHVAAQATKPRLTVGTARSYPDSNSYALTVGTASAKPWTPKPSKPSTP